MLQEDKPLRLTPVGSPRQDDTHAPFLIASLSMATLAGFVLGAYVPLARLLNWGSPDRTNEFVHAHGQVQLLGFAGLFVMGMSLRLMPRFAGSRIVSPTLVHVTLALFVMSLSIRAGMVPWVSGGVHTALVYVSAYGVLVASGCFLLLVSGTLTLDARRFDPASLAFLIGSFLLFLASTVAAFATFDAGENGSGTLPYLANNAIVQLEMFGF